MTYTKTKQAKKFVDLVESMPFAEILKAPNATTKKTIEAARKGETRKHKSASEMIAFLNK